MLDKISTWLGDLQETDDITILPWYGPSSKNAGSYISHNAPQKHFLLDFPCLVTALVCQIFFTEDFRTLESSLQSYTQYYTVKPCFH